MNDNQVTVYFFTLAASPAQLACFSQCLSPDELAKANQYKFPHLRERYIIARSQLRYLLGAYLQQAPESLRFIYNSHGKPQLADFSAPQFNVSHSRDKALIALTPRYALGVDIEYLDVGVDAVHLAQRFFAPSEAQVLQSLPDAEKTVGFFNAWTRKEALLKAFGEGLSFPLRDCEVSLRPQEPARVITVKGDSTAARHWSLHDLQPDVNYKAAIAIATATIDLQFECYTLPES